MRPSRRHRLRRAIPLLFALVLVVQPASAGGPPTKADPGLQNALDHLNQRARAYGLANMAPPSDTSDVAVAVNFEVLGHNSLGARDTNADVWAHDDFAYVGTWAFPCTGRGVKIIDVSDLTAPRVVGALASRRGTSAEDVVVRAVDTASFTGDLLAVGIQRCGPQGGPRAQYGAEFWDVSDPTDPEQLSVLQVTNGGGGVHELDLMQRGDRVYALLATPFSEWFDPVSEGDFRIVDVTDPRNPVQVAEWGARDELGHPGPFFGLGSFGAAFGHSARFSTDGSRAYVSYWDIGLLTFDISNVSNPVLVGQTEYPVDVDGDLHSTSEYGDYLLTNDEDFDPRSPARITFGADGFGVGSESPAAPALWEVDPTTHAITDDVVMAENEGCDATDYPAAANGAIVVVQTPFDIFGAVEQCPQGQQEALAEAAGAVAVVHRFDSTNTSPQWFSIGPVGIPVLFTDRATADGMVNATAATLTAQEPTWGFLRVYDKETGDQVAKFDDVFGINDLEEAGTGFWSIHNNEVKGDRSYVSWYSNGIIALDLSPLDGAVVSNPVQVGQFIPGGSPSVWGVFVRDDNVIFASDEGSGLWIVQPTGQALPSD